MAGHVFVRRMMAMLAFCFLSGCDDGGTAGVTLPPKVEVITMVQLGPASFFAQPGESITQTPAIKLTSSNGNSGVANVPVTFTTEGPAGYRSVFATATDAQGIARLTSLKLSELLGEYRIVVASGEDLVVVFKAVVRGRINASYQLVHVDGKQIAPTYPPSYYVLFEGGSFVSYSDTWGVQFATPGSYRMSDSSTISFYIDPGSAPAFYREQNYLYGTGRISGSTMTVTYVNTIDFETETYELRQ